MTSISENISFVQERMESACLHAGRKIDDVRLVAVSKYMPTERIAEAVACGLRIFGENHAQELCQKQTFFEQNGCTVHFIGQLQSNKIKYVCGIASLIESVDRESLAEALERRAETLDIVQDLLIQINIGREAQKGGINGEDLDSFTALIAENPHLRLRGLMCVPPAVQAEEARVYFRNMRVLFERLRSNGGFRAVDTLSMGMSHDFETAIEEGATEVRVGTAIFGARGKL